MSATQNGPPTPSVLPDRKPPDVGGVGHAPQVEYANLTAYFEKLVKYTYGAIVLVLAAAGLLLWRNISDVRNDAGAAIEATKRNAAEEISKTASQTADIARTEAQKRIDEAFERSNVQQLIERTARDKVNTAVDQEIKRNLSARIQVLQDEIAETGEIANAGARLRLEFRPALDTLLKKSDDPNEAIRGYAKSTLLLVGSDYETRLKELVPQENASQLLSVFSDRNPPPATLKEMMDVIHHSQNVKAVVASFIAMRQLTATQLQIFDIPAAEKWCADHRPKCE